MTNREKPPGTRVGRLTITGRAGTYTEGSGRTRILYRVKCDCGREEDIRANRLSGPKRVGACTTCRTPVCRACGASLARPTRFRVCSAECRRILTAIYAQESRMRRGDAARIATVAANRARIAAMSPEERAAWKAAKAASDRRLRAFKAGDPEWIATRRARRRAAYAEMAATEDGLRKINASARRKRAIQSFTAAIMTLRSISDADAS